jgi:hypothetical protein
MLVGMTALMMSALQAPQALPGHATEQTPAWHSASRAQAMPHLPQFAVLVCTSTQLPSQSVKRPQLLVQAPSAQAESISSQEFVQLPQCPGSVRKSVQMPSQLFRPVAQPEMQRPFLQVSPDLQIRPQMPQFAISVAVSTQMPAHSSVPDLQMGPLPVEPPPPQLATQQATAASNTRPRRASVEEELQSRIKVPPQAVAAWRRRIRQWREIGGNNYRDKRARLPHQGALPALQYRTKSGTAVSDMWRRCIIWSSFAVPP